MTAAARASLKSCVALIVGAVLLLSGCVAEQTTGTEPQLLTADQIREYAAQERDAGHTEQAGILDDGKVTSDEYSNAFGLLADCLSAKGLLVSEPAMDPVSNVRYAFSYDYNGINQVEALRVIDSCEAVFWTSVSVAFSLSREERMDPALADYAAGCLRDRGYAPAEGSSSVRDLVHELGDDASDDVVECVHRGVLELFPDLPSVAIGY